MTDPKVPANLADALAELMRRLPLVTKDQDANIKPGFSYSYADLHDISRALLPVLGELGLSFTSQPKRVRYDDGNTEFVLAWRLLHVSGDMDEGEWPLPDPNTVSPQTLGGRITYARRYCLCAVTGLTAGGDDDDAQAAEGEYRRTEAELQGRDLAEHNKLRRQNQPVVRDLQTGKLEHHVKGTDPDDGVLHHGNGEHRPGPTCPSPTPPGSGSSHPSTCTSTGSARTTPRSTTRNGSASLPGSPGPGLSRRRKT